MSAHENEVPGRIKVMNPFSGEYEIGDLTERGVFIADTVELDATWDKYSFEPRVILLGSSSVSSYCRIGQGSVINGAYLCKADIGRSVTVGEGSSVLGPVGAGRATVDDNVTIGEDSFITDLSYIAPGVVIGDHVAVDHSIVDDDCVIESGSNDAIIIEHQLGEALHTTQRTRLTNARIGARTVIGSDAIITNFDIPEDSVIVSESRISRSRRAQRIWS